MPALRCSTASIIARRLRVEPDRERGAALRTAPASTSACTSTSIGRVPSSVGEHARARRAARRASTRKSALGLADAPQPLLGHREDADLVDGAEAVL